MIHAGDTVCCFCIAEFRLFTRLGLIEAAWDLPSTVCSAPCNWHAEHPHEEHDEMGKILARLTENWRHVLPENEKVFLLEEYEEYARSTPHAST